MRKKAPAYDYSSFRRCDFKSRDETLLLLGHLVSMTLSGNDRLSVALVSVVLRPWLLLLRTNSPMPNRPNSTAMATTTPTMMAVLSLSVWHVLRIWSYYNELSTRIAFWSHRLILESDRHTWIRLWTLIYEVLPASSNPWADMYTK